MHSWILESWILSPTGNRNHDGSTKMREFSYLYFFKVLKIINEELKSVVLIYNTKFTLKLKTLLNSATKILLSLHEKVTTDLTETGCLSSVIMVSQKNSFLILQPEGMKK